MDSYSVDDLELLTNLMPEERADIYADIAECFASRDLGGACDSLSDLGLHELSDAICDAMPKTPVEPPFDEIWKWEGFSVEERRAMYGEIAAAAIDGQIGRVWTMLEGLGLYAFAAEFKALLPSDD